MVSRGGISEKKLGDKRFKRTEGRILQFFFQKDGFLKAKNMVKEIGITRSTFYRHHRSIGSVISDYDKYIIKQYKRLIRKNRGASTRVIYLKTLYYIHSEIDAFRVFVKYCDEVVFYKMMHVLEPEMSKRMKLPKNSQLLYMVYASEIARLMYAWGERGFLEEEIEKTMENVLKLTEMARARLKILLE